MAGGQRESDKWWAARRRMVDDQIRRRGITDSRVVDAMLAVPREQFLPKDLQHAAYEDRALAVEHGQTISQPYIVAYMTEQLTLTPDCRVLEIGTGTGYQTAVLAELAEHVFTLERIPELKRSATDRLAAAGATNVTLFLGDGSLGLPLHAPFARIIATAAAPKVPEALVRQLDDGGVLVMPIGGTERQTIVRVVREGDRSIETPSLACRFVKLVGEQGWRSDPAGR